VIAIDTNVLLRYLLQDNPEQARKASKLINGKERVLITDAVLVETIWTLKGKKYQQKKPALVATIQALFKESNLRFENNQAIWLALNDYRKAKLVNGKEVEFSDALIVNKSKVVIDNHGGEFNGF